MEYVAKQTPGQPTLPDARTSTARKMRLITRVFAMLRDQGQEHLAPNFTKRDKAVSLSVWRTPLSNDEVSGLFSIANISRRVREGLCSKRHLLFRLEVRHRHKPIVSKHLIFHGLRRFLLAPKPAGEPALLSGLWNIICCRERRATGSL